MESQVIVTGASGSIGTYLCDYLGKRNVDVIAWGRRRGPEKFFADRNILYQVIKLDDITSADLSYIKPGASVVHLAGPMPSTMKGYSPSVYVSDIISKTLNLLKLCVDIDIKKFVFSHTRADSNRYVSWFKTVPSDVHRSFPKTGDHSIYAICKNAAVDLINHFYYEHAISRYIIRLPTVYQYHPNKYFYVNGEKKIIAYRKIIDDAINNRTVEIWGDPMKEKEIVYIEDVCQLILRCLRSDKDGGIYNAGAGRGVTLKEQVLGIVEVFSSGDAVPKVSYRPEKPDAREFIHDITKPRRELGYKPEYDYMSLLRAFKKEMELQRFRDVWGTEEDFDNHYN